MEHAAKPAPQQRTVMVKFGAWQVTGWWAFAIAMIILMGIIALVAHSRPSKSMLATGAVWIFFITYWSAAAKNKAPTKSAESQKSRATHQILLDIALLLLFIPVWGLTRRFLPASQVFVPVGLVVQVLFLLFAIWARRHLGRNWSSEVRIAQEHKLITTGPYRVVRHPIYTAMFGMGVGTAIVSGQWHALIGVVLLLIAYQRKLRMEEEAMMATFGAEYEAYKRSFWALVPGVY